MKKLLIASLLCACAHAQSIITNLNFRWEQPLNDAQLWQFYISPTNLAWTNITVLNTTNYDAFSKFQTFSNGWYVTKVTALNEFVWYRMVGTNKLFITNHFESAPGSNVWVFWQGVPTPPVNRTTDFIPTIVKSTPPTPTP